MTRDHKAHISAMVLARGAGPVVLTIRTRNALALATFAVAVAPWRQYRGYGGVQDGPLTAREPHGGHRGY